MAQLTFKTNIDCMGCKARVTPFLDENFNIYDWDVDLRHDDRILSVTGDVTDQEVIETIARAGYKAEKI
ncbi:MAG: cation transporter [Cyclobacteriaceae bacterium]|nr:cation transporter [Cyclobacteriaceae bacterium]